MIILERETQELEKKNSTTFINITKVKGVLILYHYVDEDIIYKEEFVNYSDKNFMKRFIELILIEE